MRYGYYGEPKRNEPQVSRAVNPLPENAKSSDTGNAGQDGYTVLSRASRYDGVRPSIDSVPDYQGPNLALDQ